MPCARFVLESSTGKYLVLGGALWKLCSTKYYWEILCARFVKLCSTKEYWKVCRASSVVQSSTGKLLLQGL